MFIDSHCHYNLISEKTGETPEELIKIACEKGVSCSVQISTGLDDIAWSLDLARNFKSNNVKFTAGIHPTTEYIDNELKLLNAIIDNIIKSDAGNLLLGIGECGLDYYRMKHKKEIQMERFSFQLQLAKKLGLPVIIHCRDAMDDTIAIIREQGISYGIMHCFQGTKSDVQRVLDLGLDISFAGNVTFKKATDLQEAARNIPSDRLLLETDAPFLSPAPLRGKVNKPEHVIHTYNFISEIKKISTEKLAETINMTFLKYLPEKRDL